MCVRAPQVIGNARNLITLEATEALAELDAKYQRICEECREGHYAGVEHVLQVRR